VLQRAALIVANKMDLPEGELGLMRFEDELRQQSAGAVSFVLDFLS